MTTPIQSGTRNTFSDEFSALRLVFSGEVITPGSAKYDEARRVANLAYDRHPAVIARPRSSDDVAAAISFARRTGRIFSVRSGSHSVSGLGVIDGAVVIDLSSMKAVSIDPEHAIARVQPGVTSADLAGPAHAYGLALSTGDTSSVGIGGLAVGGGIGWLVRKYGLTIDSLLSAEIVTADGRILTANPVKHPDLFWAIRGGGGNFGVITSYEFQLAPVGSVYGGAIVLPATKENIRAYFDYAATAPDELTTILNVMHAPPAPFIPEANLGQLIMMLLVCYTGDAEEGARVVAPLRAIAEPIADAVAPIPYPVIYAFTDAAAQPHGAVVRSMFGDGLSDATIEASLEAMSRAPSPMSMVQFRALGGAMAEVPEAATAFAHRKQTLMYSVLAIWPDQAEDTAPHQAWAEGLWRRVRGEAHGAYVNFLGDEGEARLRDAYPSETYAWLADVKRKYDPENVFKFNQNIKPSAAGTSEHGI